MRDLLHEIDPQMATEIKTLPLKDPDENLDDASERFDEIGEGCAEGVNIAVSERFTREGFCATGHNATPAE